MQAAKTLAQIAHNVAVDHVPVSVIEASLNALGEKVHLDLGSLDAERKSALVNHFVRAMRNVGVSASSRLEHALLQACGCSASERRCLALKNAISLIAVRNQVHQLATALGMPWNESMRLQSALADVARFVIERGGGKIEIEETGAGLSFTVTSDLDLGVVTSTLSQAAPAWLAGTLNLAKDFRSKRCGSGTLLEFMFPKPASQNQSLVA